MCILIWEPGKISLQGCSAGSVLEIVKKLGIVVALFALQKLSELKQCIIEMSIAAFFNDN